MHNKGLRHLVPFILLSALIHFVGLLSYEQLQRWSYHQETVRVRFSAVQHHTFSVANDGGGMGVSGQAVPRFSYPPEAVFLLEHSGVERHTYTLPAGEYMEPGGRGGWQSTEDGVGLDELNQVERGNLSLIYRGQKYDIGEGQEQFRASRLLEFDAERHVRTSAIADRKTGKLKKAYLYVPCYRRLNELERILSTIEGGHRTPNRPPIVPVVDYMNPGMYDPKGGGSQDLIHSFPLYVRRHLLHTTELDRYTVLLTKYIDVESTDTMVAFLSSGGFVICESVERLYSAVSSSRGWDSSKLKVTRVGVEHRLFHSYYDINKYEFHGIPCSPIAPIPALEYEGRVIAVSPPPFNYNTSCKSNMLFVNSLAFGLVQGE